MMVRIPITVINAPNIPQNIIGPNLLLESLELEKAVDKTEQVADRWDKRVSNPHDNYCFLYGLQPLGYHPNCSCDMNHLGLAKRPYSPSVRHRQPYIDHSAGISLSTGLML